MLPKTKDKDWGKEYFHLVPGFVHSARNKPAYQVTVTNSYLWHSLIFDKAWTIKQLRKKYILKLIVRIRTSEGRENPGQWDEAEPRSSERGRA